MSIAKYRFDVIWKIDDETLQLPLSGNRKLDWIGSNFKFSIFNKDKVRLRKLISSLVLINNHYETPNSSKADLWMVILIVLLLSLTHIIPVAMYCWY